MKILSLSFEKDVEEQFLHRYYSTSLKHSRIALLVGLLIFAAFGLQDSIIAPSVYKQLWIVRYALVCPVIGICFILTFFPWFERYYQPCVSLIILFAGLCLLVVASLDLPRCDSPCTALTTPCASSKLRCVCAGRAVSRTRLARRAYPP